MKVIKVKQQPQGYKVTTEDNKEHSIPYIKGTFLYKETKAFIDGRGTIEPEFTQAEIDKEKQAKENQTNQSFLDTTDWKVTRHRDQLALKIETSLTEVEFQKLLQDRQIARDSIVKITI